MLIVIDDLSLLELLLNREGKGETVVLVMVEWVGDMDCSGGGMGWWRWWIELVKLAAKEEGIVDSVVEELGDGGIAWCCKQNTNKTK